MIIEKLLDAIYGIMNVLMVLNIPDLPEEVYGYIDTAFGYMADGAGILANYIPLGYFLVLFAVIVGVDAGVMIYHLVMWILKKIPFIGVE